MLTNFWPKFHFDYLSKSTEDEQRVISSSVVYIKSNRIHFKTEFVNVGGIFMKLFNDEGH